MVRVSVLYPHQPGGKFDMLKGDISNLTNIEPRFQFSDVKL